MCRRPLSLVLLLLPVFVGPLEAQDIEAELQRQIDSLARLVEESAVEAEAARRAREEAARRLGATRLSLDTLQVGPLRVVTLRSDGALARQLFAEVWEERYRGYDTPSLSERTFTFQRTVYEVQRIPVAEIEHQVAVPRWSSRDQAKARIRNAIGQALLEDLVASPAESWSPGSVRTWSSTNPFTDRDPAYLYRQMVLTMSRSVRLCLEGDTRACAISLDLGTAGDVLEAWYTPEERRRLVAATGRANRRVLGVRPVAAGEYFGPEEVQRCTEAYDIDRCDALLRFNLGRWSPLPGYVRASLVGLALERGGQGAWERLLEDRTMRVEEALVHAAGVPLEELVAEWRDWVVSNRPELYAGIGGESALVLLWVIVFAILATRSTRWRFS